MVLIALGIACLFFPYTLLLGVAILALAAIALVAPHFLPGTASRVYRETLYLYGPVTFGVTEEGLWARAADLSAELSWRHVTMWYERDGWFILRGNGFPLIMFPVDGLEAARVYGHVRALAARHGVEFKGRGVRRGRPTNRFGGPASPVTER